MDMRLKREVAEKLIDGEPVILGYARWGIVFTAACMIPVYGLWIWILVSTERTWLRIMLALSVPLFLAINLKALMRLGDSVELTSEGITRRSLFGETRIPWSDVKRVHKYTSLLERDCLRIESVTGDRITVSEYLVGYDCLYSSVLRHSPALGKRGSAELPN